MLNKVAKKKDKLKVTIISRESDEKTLDVRMLEEELRQRGVRVKVLSKLLTKEKSVKNAVGYLGHALRQEAEILSSDVVVLDTYCIPASMIPHRSGTKVIQMWHALGAVKKFGWQTVGKPDGTSERTAKMMRMHSGYDYVICPSDVTADYFSEAFRISKDKIVKLGLPRIDYIRNVTHGDTAEQTKARIVKKYPELAEQGKKTILYAPTFRRGAAPNLVGLADALDPEKYNIIVKLHPLYGGGGRLFRDNIIYDEEFETYELIAAADAVVSDYSSLVIEETLSDKPLYLYTYDIDEYMQSTGLNMDFASEPIGKYTFKDATDLAKALEEPYDSEALREFGKKYIDIDSAWEDGSCTADLADFIISMHFDR